MKSNALIGGHASGYAQVARIRATRPVVGAHGLHRAAAVPRAPFGWLVELPRVPKPRVSALAVCALVMGLGACASVTGSRVPRSLAPGVDEARAVVAFVDDAAYRV